MKKIIFSIFLCIGYLLYAATYYVGPTQTYTDIQSAINVASDNDVIIVDPGEYDAIDFLFKNLTIKSRYEENNNPYYITNTAIIGDSSYSVNMRASGRTEINGFTITNGTDGIYKYAVSCTESTYIKNCIITGNTAKGIFYFNGNNENLFVENCEIKNNVCGLSIMGLSTGHISNTVISENEDFGVFVYGTDPCNQIRSSITLYLNNCIFKDNFFDDNTEALHVDFGTVEIEHCLFSSNSVAIREVYSAGLTSYFDIDRSTFSANTIVFSGISNPQPQNHVLNITNSIIWGNTNNPDIPVSDISYTDIQGGYSGTGNISEDPYFCSEYPYEYWLMEGSPCIDAGDPSAFGGDARIDMGCFETTTDIKKCEGEHWNWVSYPRLNREDDEGVDATDTLDEFLDWPFHLEMLYDVIFWSIPTLEYDDNFHFWAPTSYNVYSSKGYKLDPDDSGDHYLPTVSDATRLAADWGLEYTLEEGDDCWLGYWLPYTQNIEDAFGEFWEDVYSVSSEDWYYEYSQFETPTSSTTNKNMVYGKGYIVVFNTDIENFSWTDATENRSYGSPGNPEPEPQYFEFADQANYEAIDVMEIPSNVVEIGVFEEDTCIGAVVVQEEDEQILAYSTEVNRDNVPFTFRVVTTNRGENLAVSDYRVMNKETGRWENRSLISGNQRSSVVMFGNLEEIQNTTPNSSVQISNLSNYPNPFNPTTTISFDLNSELTEDTEITIYNMKGQKVKTLPISKSQSLTVSVSWDGTDDEGNNVSSGLYFYKVRLHPDSSGKTADHEYSKKMLLLK